MVARARRGHVGCVQPDRLELRCCLCLGLPDAQRSADFAQLLVEFPAIVDRRLGGLSGGIGRAFRGFCVTRTPRRLGAQHLAAPRATQLSVIARGSRRHILLALFAPHGILTIGCRLGKLYRFRGICGRRAAQWGGRGRWAVCLPLRTTKETRGGESGAEPPHSKAPYRFSQSTFAIAARACMRAWVPKRPWPRDCTERYSCWANARPGIDSPSRRDSSNAMPRSFRKCST